MFFLEYVLYGVEYGPVFITKRQWLILCGEHICFLWDWYISQKLNSTYQHNITTYYYTSHAHYPPIVTSRPSLSSGVLPSLASPGWGIYRTRVPCPVRSDALQARHTIMA